MTIRLFSFGGGVQSMACLVLAAQGAIDYQTFLFCDVGTDSENPATLAYLANVAEPYANTHGLTIIRLAGKRRTLMQTLQQSQRSIPIPVRMSNGAPGRRSCTTDYKIRPVSAYVKKAGATVDDPAIIGLGISIDEAHRMRSASGRPLERLAYPLVQLRLNRSDCAILITDAGLPVPPKSSCWFCPFHTASAWQRQHDDEPELFQQSVALEQLLNERRRALGRDDVYFHSRLIPLGQACIGHQTTMETGDYAVCESGYCMT